MRVKNNQLFLGKFSAKFLAKKFGTPLYVYEAETIRLQYLKFAKNIAYSKLRIHYACKANTNILILKLLRKLGAKIETVSKGEIVSALKAGFKPEDIIFTSTSVSKEEMIFVIKNKIRANMQTDIAGNVCESGDVFARDRKITRVKVGDILAILNAGAYGYVMASRYNSRPLPKEILIDGSIKS